MTVLPEKPLPAWMVVPGVELPEGMPSPSPIKCVLAGKIHVERVLMVPAGSRMVEGALTVVEPLLHGVVPLGHVRAVEPLIPRASTTAPMVAENEEGKWPERMP